MGTLSGDEKLVFRKTELTEEFRELKRRLLGQWDDILLPEKRPKTVCLPDFFFDVLVSPKKDYSTFLKEIDDVFSRGGGVYKLSDQWFSPGGNAGNLAVVLGALGRQPTFVSKVSPFGKHIIEILMKPYGVELVITDTGITPSTVAFEFRKGESVSNVMINANLETLSKFGPQQLEDLQWEVISKADIVAVTNYCANDLYLDLVRGVADHLSSHATIFLDFSDISHREDSANEIHEMLLDLSEQISTVSLNESEVAVLGHRLTGGGDALGFGLALSENYPSVTFCVHTATFSSELKKGSLVKAPALPITPKRATGAGDTFNAGYIAAVGIDPVLRLFFANCCASYRMVGGEIPNMEKVKAFLESIE